MVIAYAEEYGNRAAERHFGPPPREKTICNWRASKEYLKKEIRFSEILKVSSVLWTKIFFSLALQSIIKRVKMLFFLNCLKMKVHLIVRSILQSVKYGSHWNFRVLWSLFVRIFGRLERSHCHNVHRPSRYAGLMLLLIWAWLTWWILHC